MTTCTELVGQTVSQQQTQCQSPSPSGRYHNLPAPSGPFCLSTSCPVCKARLCLNEWLALFAQWSYQAAQDLEAESAGCLSVTTSWAVVKGRTQGAPSFHRQTPERPRAGCGEQDSMLPRMSGARIQVLLRNQPAGRNQKAWASPHMRG